MTDGHYKYIWFTQTGQKQLFNLDEDPHEIQDLTLNSSAKGQLKSWRERMVEVLDHRPEKFVEDGKLVVGRPHYHVIPDYQPDKIFPFA